MEGGRVVVGRTESEILWWFSLMTKDSRARSIAANVKTACTKPAFSFGSFGSSGSSG